MLENRVFFYALLAIEVNQGAFFRCIQDETADQPESEMNWARMTPARRACVSDQWIHALSIQPAPSTLNRPPAVAKKRPQEAQRLMGSDFGKNVDNDGPACMHCQQSVNGHRRGSVLLQKLCRLYLQSCFQLAAISLIVDSRYAIFRSSVPGLIDTTLMTQTITSLIQEILLMDYWMALLQIALKANRLTAPTRGLVTVRESKDGLQFIVHLWASDLKGRTNCEAWAWEAQDNSIYSNVVIRGDS